MERATRELTTRYFDDLALGMTFYSSEFVFNEDEIIAFAKMYDPQPYHVDHEAAKASKFQGLVASGWHTNAVMMRLMVDMAPFGSNPIFGRGVDELRWYLPTRPGDRLRAKGEVLALSPSNSTGTVRFKVTGINQDDQEVCSMVTILVVPRNIKGTAKT